MYYEHFGFSEAPFNVTPDSRFFFVNPCYEEAFATLGYGIEARKGFIVLTGEPGTGKTTLLKRLMSMRDSNVQGVCIFDPHLSFVELLRLTLSELGLESAGRDRLPMMTQLYDHLVRLLESSRVVCLMIDEAQSLSEEMLEELRLLSNFETDTEKLIQIVLAGQPELEARLDSPRLLQLKQRVALRCRLKPLQPREIERYIACRLQTVHCPRRDLFDRDSIERIARYSHGVPRLINSICDSALLISFTHDRRYVLASDVDEAARELQLSEASQVSAKAAERDWPRPSRPRPFEFERDEFDPDRHPEPSRAFGDEVAQRDFKLGSSEMWERPAGRDWLEAFSARRFGVLLTLLMAATALFFSIRQKPSLLPDTYDYIVKLGDGLRPQGSVPPSAPVARIEPRQADSPAPAQISAPEAVAPTNQRVEGDDVVATLPSTPEESQPASVPDRYEKPAAEDAARVADRKRPASKNSPSPGKPADLVDGDKELEIRIYKAIHDRAISGVHVDSVRGGTISLGGRVATARQKLAAVRAALSVPGVKNVQDRIVVQWAGESTDSAGADRSLEAKVYQAIRDRAITGVQVASTEDGIVYLDGRVATARQKLAAVHAALGVPGVRDVRDRIIVQ